MALLVQILRFPRTKDSEMVYLAKIRTKYPPPPYNPRTDGSLNPADWIFDWLCKRKTKKLRKLCVKHALDNTGSRRQLIKLMYLHWRAVKSGIGKEWIGYGPGYENTRMPDCCPSAKSREYVKKAQAQEEKWKEHKRYMRKYVMLPSRIRFPRYSKKRIHFPRLEE